MIDLACETQGRDYFRSEDPMEAARFVVSDAAAALWSAIRKNHGFAQFSERAAGRLLRGESRHGRTRYGYGWVSQRETALAQVVARMLPAADAWGQFADQYLRSLDHAAQGGRGARAPGVTSEDRAEALSEWHALLLTRLTDGDHEDRLDVLVEHRALAGPELTLLQTRLAERRGDRDGARRLVRTCLDALPGHPRFRAFAGQVGASPRPRAVTASKVPLRRHRGSKRASTPERPSETVTPTHRVVSHGQTRVERDTMATRTDVVVIGRRD